MTETTADNREHDETTEPEDSLDRVDLDLDGLDEMDPSDAVAVLADITAELNRELDADADRF